MGAHSLFTPPCFYTYAFFHWVTRSRGPSRLGTQVRFACIEFTHVRLPGCLVPGVRSPAADGGGELSLWTDAEAACDELSRRAADGLSGHRAKKRRNSRASNPLLASSLGENRGSGG